MSIIIDKEFESLIPPLTADEFSQLEENCVKDGIREPLVVWKQDDGNSILIDGHNRFKIIAKHMLHYTEIWKQFKNRDEAKAWIIRNQLGRRNIDKWIKFDMAKELEALEKIKAKERQGTRTDIVPTLAQSDTGKTRDKISAQIGVSHGTYDKMKAIDESNDEKLKEQVRSGDVSINQGYRIVKGIEDKHPAKAMQEFVERKKEEHKEFKDKKTVSLDEIKADKETKRFLAMDAYTKLMRMGKQITDISFAIADGDINLEEVAKELTEEEQVNLITTIAKWIVQLTTITEVISA